MSYNLLEVMMFCSVLLHEEFLPWKIVIAATCVVLVLFIPLLPSPFRTREGFASEPAYSFD
jgi:hypothetical protein